MAFDSKEYTRLRDIAQKRIKRGQAAGYGLDGVKVPTVKELRQRGEYAQQIEMMRLQQFLQTGFSLERRRQASRETLTEEQRRERRREQSRDYRRRKKTYDYEPDQILGDFQKFEAEQAEIASRAGSMEGMTAEKAVGLWDEFVNR